MCACRTQALHLDDHMDIDITRSSTVAAKKMVPISFSLHGCFVLCCVSVALSARNRPYFLIKAIIARCFVYMYVCKDRDRHVKESWTLTLTHNSDFL